MSEPLFVFKLTVVQLTAFSRMAMTGSINSMTQHLTNLSLAKTLPNELKMFEELALQAARQLQFHVDITQALSECISLGSDSYEFAVPKAIHDFMRSIAHLQSLSPDNPAVQRNLVDRGHSLSEYRQRVEDIRAAIDGATETPVEELLEPVATMRGPDATIKQ